MRWRKALISGGAALGLAATFNALIGKSVAPLENLIGGEEGWFHWRGHRIAYTKRGSGPPLLLVHGIHATASSFEWRFNVDELARNHTVYTIDLLGFGRSDRPAIRYSARLYLALIADFVAQVVASPVVIVATSRGTRSTRRCWGPRYSTPWSRVGAFATTSSGIMSMARSSPMRWSMPTMRPPISRGRSTRRPLFFRGT